LPSLVAHLKAPVEKALKEQGSLLENALRENVLLNVEALRNSTPVLADMVKGNRLRVVVGLYELATGGVEVLTSKRYPTILEMSRWRHPRDDPAPRKTGRFVSKSAVK
jgi:carbonic anhydrase